MMVRESEPPAGPERYAVLGGLAAWRLPLLAALIALGALVLGAWTLAAGSLALGWAAMVLSRAAVIEISPSGLTRGITMGDTFLGWATVLPWHAVVGVHTDWRRPGDDSALETTVRGRDGTTIRFSTAMGLRSYWTCLAGVAGRLPRTLHSGLTAAVLAEGPPSARHVLAAVKTAAALALLIAALVGVHYLWAQGRSSLSRYLEHIGDPSAAEQVRW